MPTAATPPASPAIDELARVLRELAAVHRDIAANFEQQHEAMRRFDTEAMQRLGRRQEASHRRVLRLEANRGTAAGRAARAAQLPIDVPLLALADAYPAQRDELLRLRQELRAVAAEAQERSRRCQRIAGSVLTHLNGAVRLLTRSSLYGRGGAFVSPPQLRSLDSVG